jgi:hypothetical protein
MSAKQDAKMKDALSIVKFDNLSICNCNNKQSTSARALGYQVAKKTRGCFALANSAQVTRKSIASFACKLIY